MTRKSQNQESPDQFGCAKFTLLYWLILQEMGSRVGTWSLQPCGWITGSSPGNYSEILPRLEVSRKNVMWATVMRCLCKLTFSRSYIWKGNRWPNCAAQARGWVAWTVGLSTSDPKPFLLFCQTQLNALTNPDSADNSHLPVTESFHSLWKSVFLLFPQPEFCLMSPVSPYGLLHCSHSTPNVDSISLFLRMPSYFIFPCLFAIEHGLYRSALVEGHWKHRLTQGHSDKLNILTPLSSHMEWNGLPMDLGKYAKC